VAVRSAEGRTNVTVTPVAVTDDTETLVGSDHLDEVAALAGIASIGDAATAAAATATQSLFINSIMMPIRVPRTDGKSRNP
jgi:hypothetical protein